MEKEAHFGNVFASGFERFLGKQARFAPVLAEGERLGCCRMFDRRLGAVMERKTDKSRTAQFRLLLSDNLLKENELGELGDFGERPDAIELENELVHYPVSQDKNGERRKAGILYQKQKIKNRFYQRISGFCFSLSYGI